MVEKTLEGGGFSVNCYQKTQLVRYVKDELMEEEKKQLEDHLYSCDSCLLVYMTILDEHENELPMIESQSFTDEVMKEISSNQKMKERRSRTNPLTHYVIAAGFTLILMFSGVFDSLTTIVSDDAMNPMKSGSFSDEMLNRTMEMIQSLNHNEKESD